MTTPLQTPPVSTAEFQAAAEQLWLYCHSLPLGYEWYRYRFPQGPGVAAWPRPNTAGWHARGEQLVTAGTFAGMAFGRYAEEKRPFDLSCTLGWGTTPVGDDSTTAVYLAAHVLVAVPYLWSMQVAQAIHASPALPPHTISRSVLPFPQMFWSLESPWPVEEKDGPASIEWFLLLDQGASFTLVSCVQPHREVEARAVIVSSTIQYGESSTAIAGSGSVIDAVLRHLSFLNSPYVKSDEERIERAVRRRCARVSPEEAEKTIRVVTLRRPSKPATGTPEPHTHEWKHQWWVTGHHRAQWYASEQAHRVKWIAPYLKGPSDKPVLEKVYAVKQ